MSSPPLEPPHEVLQAGGTTYEFVRCLGLAHHGELVLASRRQEGVFGGFTVIKRPLPPVSEETRRRLMEEARLSSQLRHPNILGALPFKGSDELPYLVMEHVVGYRLQSLLEASARAQQPLSEAFSCHVVAEVADALHHAHTLVDEHGRELGVVHRDVTPHNILLSEHGEVKLLDFGAAWSRLSGRTASEGPTLQGSLAYAAPEHAGRLALDGRADQFSLGLVLLQMLTGRHLFEGADRFDARQRHARAPESEATRQSARVLAERIRGYSLKDLEPATRSVPEALRPIVLRALAPVRADRFPSCAHFSRALREHLHDAAHHYNQHDVLSEVITLRYIALRLEAGDSPDLAHSERHLPEHEGQELAGSRAARPRGGGPRRR